MKAPTFKGDPTEFAGKRVFVSGGTKGAGEAMVRRLAAAGAEVITSARTAPADAALPARFIAADLTTAEGTGVVARVLRDECGGVDVLIHNLGGSHAPGGGFAALTDDLWLEELNLNLLAAVRLDRALVPDMVARGRGVVIHISSIQRQLPLPESTTAYAAAKAALTTYSKALSKELGPKGVRVTSVSPGWIYTTAAEAMVQRLAENGGTDEETARQGILSALGGAYPSGARPGRGRWRNWWPFWPPTVRRPFMVRNTSSMEGQFRRCEPRDLFPASSIQQP